METTTLNIAEESFTWDYHDADFIKYESWAEYLSELLLKIDCEIIFIQNDAPSTRYERWVTINGPTQESLQKALLIVGWAIGVKANGR